MKIGHLSDLHYSGEYLTEVESCTKYAVDALIQAGVDAVVISGDATDHRLDMHSPAAIALVRQVRRLADHCPVLMLQGTYSHEVPGTLDIFSQLGGRYPVYVADGIGQVALTYDSQWVEAPGWRFESVPENGACLFSCVPTVNKASVAAAVGASDAAEAVGDVIAELLTGFASINLLARQSSVATVLVSHGTVNGCKTEHGVPMVGLDHEFTVGSLFAAEASAAMLGHIHAFQSWQDGGRFIAYAGSIGRLHYGEMDAKGFLIWDVQASSASFEFMSTPARQMIHVDFTGTPDMEELAEIAAKADGAFVRIRWSVDEEHRDSIDRKAIETMFGNAAEAKLEGRVVPIVRTRAEGINRASTLEEKLLKWASTTKSDSSGLTERLALLLGKEPEEIAAGILAA